MKKIKFALFNTFVLYIFLLLLQLAYIVVVAVYVADKIPHLNRYVRIVAAFIVLYILSKPMDDAFKIAWSVPIMAFPFAGSIAYFVLKAGKIPRKHRNIYKAFLKENYIPIKQDNLILEHTDEITRKQANRTYQTTRQPIACSQELQYFNTGEMYAQRLLEELDKAEKFIFLEFFIINRGQLWLAILDILKNKASQGVEVRIMYDDVGSMRNLSIKYIKYIRSLGIEIQAYNRFKPFLNIQYNNRSHRKIVIIDGKVAFTGGINLADEYINAIKRFGHWKDSGIMITGSGVDNFTLSSLLLWSIYKPDQKVDKYIRQCLPVINDRFILPFVDMPNDTIDLCLDTILQMIADAKKYIYLSSPYFIVTDKVTNALIRAQASGVDVRLIVPGIPDKKIAYEITKSHYAKLVRNNVKVYKYTPGFIHSKLIVADDKYAFVSTCNLDYRSLYLHLEDGVYVDNVEFARKVRADFDEIIKVSELQDKDKIKVNFFRRFIYAVLRLFAPMF